MNKKKKYCSHGIHETDDCILCRLSAKDAEIERLKNQLSTTEKIYDEKCASDLMEAFDSKLWQAAARKLAEKVKYFYDICGYDSRTVEWWLEWAQEVQG
jgi:hypothetical protein